MDILAHGLWVGVGAAWMHRHRRLDRRTTALAVSLAVVPDLAQLLPLVYPGPVFYPVTYWGFDGIAWCYFALLEMLFLVVRVPFWERNAGKRLVKAPKVFLPDSSLLSYKPVRPNHRH